jgi:hypothetical protein
VQHQGYNDALEAVRRTHAALPANVHGEDPRTLQSRILAGHMRAPSYDEALHLAALSVALVVAIDRAECMDITTGEAA